MGYTIKSIKWSGIDRISSYIIQFVISIFIARCLSPEDYGAIAMLSIFITIAQTFIEAGFNQALIQKQNRTLEDTSTVFYFNIVVAIFLYILFVVSSPLIASFYKLDILNSLISIVGLNFIISSLATVQRAYIAINNEFKKLAAISTFGALLGGITGLLMAYNGYGVWSLVYSFIISNTSDTVLLWLFSNWKPKLCFSILSFKELFAFGSKLLASNILHRIYTQLYNVVIGKVYEATELGFFGRAQSLCITPSSIFTSTISRAVYPIECKIQDKDDLLTEKFLMYISYTSMVVFPIMLGISSVAKPLISIILTDKWLPSVPYIQILCFSYMFDPIMGLSADLLSVKKRSDYVLKTEIIKKIVAFIILFSTLFGGLKMMCYGLVLYSIFDIIIVYIYISKVIPQLNITKLTKTIAPLFFCSFVMFILVSLYVHFEHNQYKALFGGIGIGVVSYTILTYILMPNKILTIIKKIKQ